ncbi:MAG: DUF4058 family protein [Cyanobacteria bacterium J06614_10]
MPIPFPGMNPYLEHPDLWPTVHQRFIAALADTLKQQLPSSYQVRLRERRYQVSGEDSLVVGSPGLDWGRHSHAVAATAVTSRTSGYHAAHQPTGSARVTTQPPLNPPIPVLVPVPQKIYETYLEIVDLDGDIVTVIEALSPKKKRPGRGRELYERQRETIFGSPTHLVEIDLLRGWEPPSIYGPDEAGDYRILISRSEQRPRAQLYTWNVMEPIPAIALPLKGPHDMTLALKPVVDQACDRTDLLVNYQQAPLPPLRFEETLWLDDFLQKVGMRPCAS